MPKQSARDVSTKTGSNKCNTCGIDKRWYLHVSCAPGYIPDWCADCGNCKGCKKDDIFIYFVEESEE